MKRLIVFDMDGTIADFYSVENWLEDLKNENPRPYEVAKPLIDMEKLALILELLQTMDYTIVITSWLSQNSSKEFKDKIRKAKKDWLAKYNFPYDEIHLVQYGTTKANCTRHHKGYQILIDDNEKIRKGWHLGCTIDANEDIIKELFKLIKSECL